MQGVLFLVVGPSGVGKDSLIDAAREAFAGDARFVFARRVVTRAGDLGGEDHEAMDEAAFAEADEAGAFAVTWHAHGLSYGVRRETLALVAAGSNVVVNVSRRAIARFDALAPRRVVLSVTAPADVVRQRLEARGREDAQDVAARLSRSVALEGVRNVVTIDNGGSLAEGARRFVAAILGAARLPLTLVRAPIELAGEALCLLSREASPVVARHVSDGGLVEVLGDGTSVRARLALADPAILPAGVLALSAAPFARLALTEGAEVEVRRAPPPASRDLLRKKVDGDELTAGEIGRVVRDLVEGRYGEAEIAGFLTAASRQLSVAEVAALTAARAEFFERIDWGGRLVVDKHSMGGVPGSRITMIVVPIVAAHGLTMPKTSSRAITSAAGTADVMECVARVDLTGSELRAVAEAVNGAIAWSGRISHSALDDVMNAIVRPLGIRSAVLDVSSILSKKLAVGAAHVVIDIPVGPAAKMRTASAGRVIANLFEEVGRSVGLDVAAIVTDGTAPIGTGVGPALELADVFAVLRGDPAAPPALRNKALDFAARLIEWDPSVPEGSGRGRAADLLASGAALAAFERIAAAQGPLPGVAPGLFSHAIVAEQGGTVTAIDGFAIADLARTAGAPSDKGAGVRLNVGVGAVVRAGTPLADVVATSQDGVDRVAGTRPDGPFTLR